MGSQCEFKFSDGTTKVIGVSGGLYEILQAGEKIARRRNVKLISWKSNWKEKKGSNE